MNEKIVLYTIDCPKCKILERKLKEADVEYEVVKDVDAMMSLGISSAPVLGVGESLLNFNEAIGWVRNRQE